MTKQPTEFVPASEITEMRRGYRLQRLEIKNFGGYHGSASVFHFDLEGAVFSGDNGAGKSTAIDAYRMLFRTQPRFNSATNGAKDRSVETYYLGQFGKKDGAGGGKAEVLRDYGIKQGFMAICGVFMTEGGQTFSALRMAFYPKKGESAEWRLITAPADISIERDFPEWPTKGKCARAAEALGGELHPNYKDFFAAIGTAFGIDDPDEASNAFRFIDQSIGVKKLGSINSFARDHIFPRNSLRKSADGAITSFEEVQESTRQIERTEAMIKELKDVARKFGFYEKALSAHSEIIQRKLHFTQFGHLMNTVRWGRVLRRATQRHDKAEAQLRAEDSTITNAEAEIEAIRIKMSDAGYDKVDDLKDLRRKILVRINTLQSSLRAMTDRFAAAGMSFDGSSETALARSFDRVSKRITELDAQIEQNSNAQSDADFNRRKTIEAKQEAAQDLESLLRNKSALNTNLIRARNQIAESLQMRPDELPFVAELAKVRDEDAEWEGVANRILGGIGSQILVETANIAAARRFLAGKKFPGTKVVLHEVRRLDDERSGNLHPDALARKIEIKTGDRFEQVARALIDSHAKHVCMDSKTFETTPHRQAAIREGSVKSGLETIKDDRSDISDRSKYILGWNIQDRIDLAREALAKKEKQVEKAEDICSQYAAGIRALGERRDAATQLLGMQQSFSNINVAGAKADLNKIEAEINALDNTEAEALRERRMDAMKRKSDAAANRDALIREQGSAASTMKTASEHMNKSRDRMNAEITTYGPATLQERRHYLNVLRQLARVSDGAATFRYVMIHKETDMDTFIAEARRKIEEANNSASKIASAGSRASKAAEAFMRNFPEADLSTNVVAEEFEDVGQASRATTIRREWDARLEKLERDDLPRHKSSFEARRKNFAIEAVKQIESEANAYNRRVRTLETGFNNILSTLTYDPMEGTRAKLRIHQRTENVAVQKFRAKLKQAVDNLYNQDTLEELVQDLIDQIKVDGDSKSALERREAILDLRNWFTMDVEEFYVNDAGEYAEQRRIYGGQDGASGGQGERLTMLLIGAAMSYTFGAGDDNRQITGLQTIMLDEAFMHGSEEMASAATDVLVAMGLQVIAATPVQKLQAFAGKTERVFSISKRNEQIMHTDSTYAELEKLEAIENERFNQTDAATV